MEDRNEIAEKMPPIHPGEILHEEFLLPMRVNSDMNATRSMSSYEGL